MNTSATTKESIMKACREIVAKYGLSALNMRSVAGSCHIALGTLYNYYSDKNELVTATVESVWMDIFHSGGDFDGTSFSSYVEHIFSNVKEGMKKYPNFFAAHALSISSSEKSRARNAMSGYFKHMENSLISVLLKDPDADTGVFSDNFSESAFVNFVIENILILVIREKDSCSTLTEIIRRIIYHRKN